MASSSSGTSFLDKFGGQGFNSWKLRMIYLLKRDGLWKLVSGEEPMPTRTASDTPIGNVQGESGEGGANNVGTVSDNSKTKWLERDQIALSTIVFYLLDEPLHQITHCNTAKEAWDELCHIYEMSDMHSKRLLQKEFWSFKVNESESMACAIAKFRSLVDRLAGVGVICTDEDKINVLLSSLPDSWLSFTNIHSNEKNLSYLIGKILQEEQRLIVFSGETKDTSSALLTVRKSGQFKKSGHSGAFKGKCFNCGKHGHKASQCKEKKKKKVSW
jgi:hypothetical protein